MSWLFVPCFKVFGFLGLKVAWFLGFKVSWFLGSKVSMLPYYQNPISCFLEDIDPVLEIFKNLLDGSLGLFGPRLFEHFQNGRRLFLRFPKIRFVENGLGFS